MKRIRLLVAGLGAVLLAAGYLASQFAFFNNEAAAYAQKVDQPPVILLALALFLIAVAFLFVPDREGTKD